MIRSMTGYGRFQENRDGMDITVEVKSVNHRYFEYSSRLPRAYGFLDDKLSVGILLGFAKWMKEEHIIPTRKIYHHFTVYEEVGHGACGTVPEDVTEILCVDMGCVGEGLLCKERQVSICAKDSAGPYTYEVVSALIEAAKRAGVDFAVDVYPHYSSDADATLRAGYDVRHGLIGAGVYASHGYERSHVDGVQNTFELLKEYLR